MTRFGIVISKLLERCIIALVLGLGVGVGLGLTQQHALELAHAEQPVASQAQASEAPPSGKADDFNFFSDKPVESKDIVVLPPEKSKWLTVGGPAALLTFMVGILLLTWRLIPFDKHSVDINLRNFPPAAKRGMALAVVLFGIAFAFGASELWYQLQFFGSSADFVASMSLGKLIVMTHAHLFGFTTAFFIVGIPFSMQFNHIKLYQWIFPIGLAACLTDVMSWWGIKYVAHSFEYVSMVCAVLFSVTYMWMLIGLLRTLAFPEVIWASDKDKAARAQKLGKSGN
ncbi:hypothetical protein [Limnobacter sp.]|uniref:hypothetical protein n=1 Tax=Limnobacter sp. TaxID=2003368 RepID=UPI00258906B8|nr:hypothetical protein [Limnobacter sp.]